MLKINWRNLKDDEIKNIEEEVIQINQKRLKCL